MKAAIFDMDGTLLDSMKVWTNITSQYMKDRDISIPDEYQKRLRTISLLDSLRYTEKFFGLPEKAEVALQNIMDLAQAQLKKECQLKPYVRETLEEMKNRGIPMCVATASSEEMAIASLERSGILDYFAFVQTCDNSGLLKKDVKYWQQAARRIGREAEATIVFEDSLHCLKTAKDTGCRVFAVEDESASHDREEIKVIADVYLPSYRYLDWSHFE